MSFVKIWVHAVWGTKHRDACLTNEVRPILFGRIKDNAFGKHIYVDCINGYYDHVHCLFELNAEITLAKTLQLLKGESAHWANQRGLVKHKLVWADEYFAISVSESMVERERFYIANQEEHHKRQTWEEEYQLFLQRYELRRDKQRHPK